MPNALCHVIMESLVLMNMSWYVSYLRDDGLFGGGDERAPHVLLRDALVLVRLVLQTRQLDLLARLGPNSIEKFWLEIRVEKPL